MTDADIDQFVGAHASLWPYKRGVYPRDTLYRLWALIEQVGAGPQLFWGCHDPVVLHGDLTAFVKFVDDPGRQLLLVANADGTELAGCIWLDDVVPGYRCFGSIFIRPKYAGAFAIEAVQLGLRYAYEVVGVEQVWGITPWRAAKHLCLRCGFQVVAVLPEFTQLNGRTRDVTVLRVMKEN